MAMFDDTDYGIDAIGQSFPHAYWTKHDNAPELEEM